MKVFLVILLLVALVASEKVFLTKRKQTYSMKVLKIGNTCEILREGDGQVHRLIRKEEDLIIRRRSQEIFEHDNIEGTEEIIEAFGSPARVKSFFTHREKCVLVASEKLQSNDADEVRMIVDSGPADNRIDVVFMGDGYTASQRELHYADMTRLTKDMFEGETFSSYLPLFNIWAVFRESVESGIGYYSTPKNTAFGLYRDGTELRGVYCSKPAAARSACTATGDDACDFPSLIANDPYYGGLGGEFTISTSSETTGTVVLRHEFGHNFGDVGEEYDGGSVYSGANSDRDLADLKWKHWLTDPNYVGPEVNAIRVQDYAWYDLAKGPYTIRFTSDGQFARWFMRFSVSGCEKVGSLIVTLDGKQLPWNTSGIIDRSFTEIYQEGGLSSGTHTLVFSSGFPPEHDMIRQLCSVSLLEYKNETEYHFSNDYVGAYPTYRQGNAFTGYRPNNENCLMRNMSSTHFCAPCKENNWLQFLSRMSLLDGVTRVTSGNQVTVTAEAVPLAQLRDGGSFKNENYVITWTQNGATRTDLTGKFSFSEAVSSATGRWTVRLEYQTTEVRADPDGLLIATESFTI